MPTLNLGVLEVAYSTAHTGDMAKNSQTTTFEVATKLEEKYHVMETFYNSRKEKIAGFLADNMAHAIQDMVSGHRTSATHGAEQKIEASFRSFLDSNEMQRMQIALTGAPISAAATRGVSHRKKHPYAMKNKERPAFIDTGTYRSAFRCVIKL
jgi:hypothetical protein